MYDCMEKIKQTIIFTLIRYFIAIKRIERPGPDEQIKFLPTYTEGTRYQRYKVPKVQGTKGTRYRRYKFILFFSFFFFPQSQIPNPKSQILGAPNGRGFSLGVKSFLKLYAHIFTKPLPSRTSSDDVKILKEEVEGTQEVSCNKIRLINKVDIKYMKCKSNSNQQYCFN